MKNQLDSLFQREMTRKEFMATIAVGLAGIAGFGSILKFVNPTFATTTATNQNQTKPHIASNTYGSSAYGG